MDFNFHIGDRVVVTDRNYDEYGLTGTLLGMEEDGWCAVCFDQKILGGHTCGGLCGEGYGWYINAEALGLLDEGDIDEDDIADTADLYAFIGM